MLEQTRPPEASKTERNTEADNHRIRAAFSFQYRMVFRRLIYRVTFFDVSSPFFAAVLTVKQFFSLLEVCS